MLIAALVWRLRRAALSLRGRLPRGIPARPGDIEHYTIFGGFLHIAGSLDVAAPVRSLALCLPGGSRLALRFAAIGPGRIHFDQTVAVPCDATEIAVAWLLVTLSDGAELLVNELGAASGDPAHELASQFRTMLAERPPGMLLEVGSRARSGFVRRDLAPPSWRYSGFDIMAGPNVDQVGDAHALSQHYAPAQFDAVMAFSVLEHLLMPWKFVIELNRVLKPGAIGLFTTHQCWPLHDQPWDFWRFSDTAWTGLLNPATGFEIIAARMGEPAYIVAQKCSAQTAFAVKPAGRLASFVLFRKTAETSLQWPVDLNAITATQYPDQIGL